MSGELVGVSVMGAWAAMCSQGHILFCLCLA